MNAGLRALLGKLQPWKVDFNVLDYEGQAVRHKVATLEEANATSSLVKGSEEHTMADHLFGDPKTGRHVVAIDLDVPAYLEESSTPGHSHLYIDVEMTWNKYKALLSALADAGVIERNYASVSIARGHSDLRLPWVKKELPEVEPNGIPVENLRFE